jgi:DNA modification methylase
MTTQIICGNNIELLKQYPDNYFDSIVTDAPYGLGKEPNAVDLMKDWVEKGYHEISGTGFMGKDWDAFVPQPLFWKEAFRVLKHGGHVLSFFGTRTYDWGVMAMRFAGFEVRDTITWHYGSGFPKSHNISKALDKLEGAEREVTGTRVSAYGDSDLSETIDGRNLWGKSSSKEVELKDKPSTVAAKKWDGWGSALKPASEPIVLARKPLEKGLSIAENVIKWGVGGINIDGCRISTNGEKINIGFSGKILDDTNGWNSNNIERTPYDSTQGRFPANVIFSHHEDCVCNGTKKVKGSKDGVRKASSEFGQNSGWNDHENKDTIRKGTADENGQEEVEQWDCDEDCPIRILDEQSGVSKSQGGRIGNKNGAYSGIGAIGFTTNHKKGDAGFGDKGGASRFFYTAKSSKGERNKGLEEFEEKPLAFSNQAKAELKRGNAEFDGGDAKGHGNSIRHIKNFHPTVKPIKLMQYLVRLITPPNGIVLDPFNGSGTTGIAAKLEGFNYVGLELDPEYCKISEARISAWEIDKPKNDNQLSLF